jgi:hypothetical protein
MICIHAHSPRPHATHTSDHTKGHAACLRPRCCPQTIARSFLGVGAPEALLVGVVALVVFGPKGLADVSRRRRRRMLLCSRGCRCS